MEGRVDLEETLFANAAATSVDPIGTGKGNLTGLDKNGSDATLISFIFTPYAFGVSGVFVLSALLLTCFQVH